MSDLIDKWLQSGVPAHIAETMISIGYSLKKYLTQKPKRVTQVSTAHIPSGHWGYVAQPKGVTVLCDNENITRQVCQAAGHGPGCYLRGGKYFIDLQLARLVFTAKQIKSKEKGDLK